MIESFITQNVCEAHQKEQQELKDAVDCGTEAWKDVPDSWLEELRGNDD